MLYLMLGLLLAVAATLGGLILWVENNRDDRPSILTIKANNPKDHL